MNHTPVLLSLVLLGLLLCFISMALLYLTIVLARKNQRIDRLIAERIKSFMDEELETITHFRHLAQDLARVAPERAEMLEVVDLQLADRHETLSDMRPFFDAMASGKQIELIRLGWRRNRTRR